MSKRCGKKYSGSKTSRPGQTTMKKIARNEAKKVVTRAEETKSYDLSALAQAVDYTTGYIKNMTDSISSSTTIEGYVGASITPIGLRIRMQLTRADATQLFRVMIIQNRAGGTPIMSTLLTTVSSITTPLSGVNRDYDHTYRILYDRLISMDSIRQSTMALNIFIKGKRLNKIWYTDTTGTLERGGIWLCVVSDSSTVTHPTIDFRSRLYFKD